MAAGGARLRLAQALQEFIASQAGDGGQMRSAQTGGEEVQLAEQLLQRLAGPSQDQGSPGQRAAQRGGLTAGSAPASAARNMLGGRGAPAGI